jgi:hypothetical protein
LGGIVTSREHLLFTGSTGRRQSRDQLTDKKTIQGRVWPAAVDEAARIGVLLYTILLSLFAIRNNDIWWHMAVGKRLVETGEWITNDPFLFSLPEIPWVPHAWLSEIVLYGIHAWYSPVGLIVFRAVIVAIIFLLLFLQLRKLGVSFTLASPFVLLVLLNAHSRFIVRPHLFGYLLVVILVGWLLSPRSREGVRFFVFPAILQVLWVNLHASFYIGPCIVFLFYLGEWINARLSFLKPGFGGAPAPPKRVALLLLLMIAVSFVNPSPLEMVIQPLSGENIELLTEYNLEWRSPFDPEIKGGAFHPYYELLLVIAVAAFAVAWRRVRVSSLLIVGWFALLSINAHRFRLEFALVALPLVLEQLSLAPLVQSVRGKLVRAGSGALRVPFVGALALSVLLIATSWDRVQIGGAVSDRFPTEAFHFVRSEGVAYRSFHSMAFGSYLIWDLYPERQAFIDGRTLSPELHGDFLACQTISAGFNGVVRKYLLDGFILPVPERCDGGMTRLHHFLMQAEAWVLVHVDTNALIYIVEGSAPDDWMKEHAYRVYHPLTFARQQSLPTPLELVAAELERAQLEAPNYPRVLLDSARFYGAIGQADRAFDMLDRVREVDPDNQEAPAIRSILERSRPYR